MKIEITEARLASLPRWARREINRLQRDVEHYKARLAVGPEDSDTFADPYSAAPRPLGRGTTIEFRLGGRDERIRASIERLGDRYLLYLNGGHRLIVQPESTNAFAVETRPL